MLFKISSKVKDNKKKRANPLNNGGLTTIQTNILMFKTKPECYCPYFLQFICPKTDYKTIELPKFGFVFSAFPQRVLISITPFILQFFNKHSYSKNMSQKRQWYRVILMTNN